MSFANFLGRRKMSHWVDRVRNHSIWSLMTSVAVSIKAAFEREGLNADMIDSLARLQTVIGYGAHRVSSTDPVLISQQALDNMIQPIAQIKANVDIFANNGDANALATACSNADSFLTNLNLILGPMAPEEIAVLSDAAADYRNALERHLAVAIEAQRNLLDKITSNEIRLDAIQVSLNSEQQRLSVLLNEQQSQFSAAQDKRASDFAATQADYLAKYTSAATEQHTEFSTDQDARKTAFSTFQRDSQDIVSTLIGEYNDRLKGHEELYLKRERDAQEVLNSTLVSIQNDYVAKAVAILAEMDKQKCDVEKLVGVIGNLGVTSGYKKVANYAKWMTVFWQLMTTAALGGLIFVAALVAFPSYFGVSQSAIQKGEVKVEMALPSGGKSSVEKSRDSQPEVKAKVEGASTSHSETDFYQGFATRVFLSITFGIFAAYAAKQASRFFETERRNRKFALELEALGPFIEPLEKSDRDKFRVQIGDRSFGVLDQESHKGKDDDPVTLAGWLKSKDGIEALTGPIKELLKGMKIGN